MSTLKERNTPLHLGALVGNKSIIRLLLRSKADTSPFDKRGQLARDMTKSDQIRDIIDDFA